MQKKILSLSIPLLVCIGLLISSGTTIIAANSSTQNKSYTLENTANGNCNYTLSFSLPPAPVRQPAEFEPMQGVLIRYPFGISYQIIKEMAEDTNVDTIVASVAQKNTVLSLYQSNGVNIAHCGFLIAPTDTYWTRDYGPWFIFNGNNVQGVVDFTYNRPRPNDDAIPVAYANNQSLPWYFMSLVTAGGNYMTDGQGIAISTDLVWSENSGYTHTQIAQLVHDYLGITTYHVVPDVNGEYIKHIDCWAKYLAPDEIMIRQVPPTHSQYHQIEEAVSYFSNQTSCYGTPYHVVRVYTPNNEPYTNSLILNKKVLVPIMGGSWDAAAISSYQTAMPGYEVLGFTGSWVSSDALHCRAMGITDRYMLYIEHTPLQDQQYNTNGFEIQATVIPYSNQPLINNTPAVYYKITGGAWNSLPMTSQGNNLYTAMIPPQPSGTTISYYIHAEDNSGRKENHPYIGAAGAHTFTVYGPMQPSPPAIPLDVTPWHTYPNDLNKAINSTNIQYTYQTNSTAGDDLYYKFFFSDGWETDWMGPYQSGEPAQISYTWQEPPAQGLYAVVKVGTDGMPSNPSSPRWIQVFQAGDCNGDFEVDFGDINPFVLLLSAGKTGYYQENPFGYYYTGDCNHDTQVNFGDINPFVALLTSS